MPPTRILALGLACALATPITAVKAATPVSPAPSVSVDAPVMDTNAAVLAAVREMPSGGQYSVGKVAFDALTRSISSNGNGLRLEPRVAQPSFCSGATYLVFLRALDILQKQGAINVDQETLNALLVVPGQRDGMGIWGRWNANGPGTARLFTELQIGRNFTDFAEARPGDFMKIFWTSEIGQRERGHSVIYLGTNRVGDQEFVRFWSSNQATGAGDLSGYGVKIVPRTKIARVIFSRLERPTHIARAGSIAKTDNFLASLLSRRVTMDEVRRMCGL